MKVMHWIPLAAACLFAWSAAAEDVKETVPAEPGGTLVVRLPGGSIEVDTHDEHRVEIEGRARGVFDLEVRTDGKTVRVTGSSRGLVPWISFGGIELHARVPEEFNLDLNTSGGHIDVQKVMGEVKAHTSGGNVEAGEIEGDVTLRTSGGSIRAQEISGSLEADTSGGEIHVSEVEGPVKVRTQGGTIRVREAGSSVEANTSGGSIEVRFNGTPAGRLHTTGGSIEVELEGGEGVHLSANTTGGRVEIDDEFETSGRISRNRVDVELDGGGSRLDVTTTGGNVVVKEK